MHGRTEIKPAYGLTEKQFAAVLAVHDLTLDSPCRQAPSIEEIAGHLGISPTAARRRLDSAEDRGYIHRIPHCGRTVSLTDRGIGLVDGSGKVAQK